MNQRLARALRRAAKFNPNEARYYAEAKHPRFIDLGDGKQIEVNRTTIVNVDNSPRHMYQTAKKLVKSGAVKNVDINYDSAYNSFKQVTAPEPLVIPVLSGKESSTEVSESSEHLAT